MTAETSIYGRHRRPGAARTVATRALLGACVTASAAGWGAHRVITAPTPTSPEPALLLGATALLAGATGWLTVLLLLSALSTLPGGLGILAHEALHAFAPHTVGAVLTVALGAGISAGHLSETLPGASAAPTPVATSTAPTPRDAFAEDAETAANLTAHSGRGDHTVPPAVGLFGTASRAGAAGAPSENVTAGPHTGTPARGISADAPGWTPTKPAPPPVLPQADLRILGGGHAAGTEITVRAGDTLWDIVGRHLGPRAGAATIAAELPRWHAANLHVIGPSADQLRPGQILTPPTTAP